MTDPIGHDPFRDKLMEKISAIHTDVAVIKTKVEGLTLDSERSRESHIDHYRAAEDMRKDIREAKGIAEGAATAVKDHKEGHWRFATLIAAIPASILALWALITKMAGAK